MEHRSVLFLHLELRWDLSLVVAIVYQVLYSDVMIIFEYATHGDGLPLGQLLAVVIREGFYLAVMGYLPAYLAGEGLFGWCAMRLGCLC